MLMTDVERLTACALAACGAQRIEERAPNVWYYEIPEQGNLLAYFTGDIRLPDHEYGMLEGAALLVYTGLNHETQDLIIAKLTELFNPLAPIPPPQLPALPRDPADN